MRSFHLTAQGINVIRKRSLLRMAGFMAILIAGACLALILNSHEKDLLLSFLIMIPVIGSAIGYGIYMGLKKQLALLATYQITISENLISRQQENLPTLSIYHKEIKEIIRQKAGSLIIKGRDSAEYIIVPGFMEDHEELYAVLETIHPITSKPAGFQVKNYQHLMGPLTLPLMLCLFYANNKIVIAISGTALLFLMGWSYNSLRKNKNPDSPAKKFKGWIVFLIVVIAMAMLSKLTGIGQKH